MSENHEEAPRCARCDDQIGTFDGAMQMLLLGYGDRGVIDTFDSEILLELCSACAGELLRAEPWLLKAAAPVLNINYAHTCVSGEVVWEPMPSCETDPDRHGWARRWLVKPVVAVARTERAPLSGPNGATAHFGVFLDETTAEQRRDEVQAMGVPCAVVSLPSGNLRFYESTEPLEWAAWWPGYNSAWLRTKSARDLGELALFCLKNPVRVARHPRQTVRLTVRGVTRAARAWVQLP